MQLRARLMGPRSNPAELSMALDCTIRWGEPGGPLVRAGDAVGAEELVKERHVQAGLRGSGSRCGR